MLLVLWFQLPWLGSLSFHNICNLSQHLLEMLIWLCQISCELLRRKLRLLWEAIEQSSLELIFLHRYSLVILCSLSCQVISSFEYLWIPVIVSLWDFFFSQLLWDHLLLRSYSDVPDVLGLDSSLSLNSWEELRIEFSILICAWFSKAEQMLLLFLKLGQ